MRSAFNANHGGGGRRKTSSLSGLFQRLHVTGEKKSSEAEEDWPGQQSTTLTDSKMRPLRPLRQKRSMRRKSAFARSTGTQGPTKLSEEELKAISAGQKSVHECLRKYYEQKHRTAVEPTNLV